MEFLLVKLVPFLKDFLPWVIIAGGTIKWWFGRKDAAETTSLTRIETLSRVEERLRESLEKQLQLTQAKLDIANKEIERMKLLLTKYQIECEKLKNELNDLLNRKSNP